MWSMNRCLRAAGNVAGQSVDHQLSAAAMHWILACFLFQSYPPLPLPGRRRRRLPHVPEAQVAALARGAKFKVVHATVDLARKLAKQEDNLMGHNPPEDMATSSRANPNSRTASTAMAKAKKSLAARKAAPPCAHCGEPMPGNLVLLGYIHVGWVIRSLFACLHRE